MSTEKKPLEHVAETTGAFNTKQSAPPLSMNMSGELVSREHVPVGPVRVSAIKTALNTESGKTTRTKEPPVNGTTAPSEAASSESSVCAELERILVEQCRDLVVQLESRTTSMDKALERTAQFIALLQSARRLNLP